MKRLLTAAVAAAALWAAACNGGGGPTIQPPPPTGNFTNASLNGTYAFVTTGEVLANGVTALFSRTGSFAADGRGNISSGVEDVVNSSGGASIASSITGGNYSINPDGRGTLTLNVASAGFTSVVCFDIALTSGSNGLSAASDGLLIDATSTAQPCNANQVSTGSGNFVKQDPTTFATTTVNGAYVFDFSGLDSVGNSASIVGQFSATSGAIITGTEDENDGGTLSSNAPIVSPASTTPTFATDPQNPNTLSSSGRGLVTISGETYAFYIVNSSRVRLISIATSGSLPPDMLTGDAVLQVSVPPSPSGSFVFLVSGSDSAGNGLTRVGRFTASGATLSKMLMDVNDNGQEGPINNLSSGSIGSYDSSTGRGTLSLQNPTTTYSFVFYLSSASGGVIQEVTAQAGSTTALVVDDGSIAFQSGNPFTTSNIAGNYAMNWSGLLTAGGTGSQNEEDVLGLVKVSNLAFSGTSVMFDFNSLAPNNPAGTSGNITLNGGDGTGNDGNRVDMAVNISGISQIHMVVYIVNPQLAFFENSDNNGATRIVAGILKAQQ